MDNNIVHFRFLSGDHIGASLALNVGSYTLGTNEECDIIVREQVKTPCKVTLEIDSDLNVFVKLDEGTVILNGEELSLDKKVAFNYGDILAINFSSLTCFKDESDIKAVTLSDLGLNLKDTEEQEQSESQDDKQDTSVEPQDNQAQVESTPSVNTVEKKTISKFVLTIVGLLLLTAIFSSLIAGSYFYTSPTREKIALQMANDYIDEQHLQDRVKVVLDENSLVFTGDLESSDLLDEFAKQLPAFEYPVTLNLLVKDNLLKAIEKSFLSKDALVTAQYDDIDLGKIALYGYVKDAYVESNLVKSVQEEFKSYILLPQFTYADRLTSLILKFSKDFSVPLDYTYDDTEIYYSGKLTLKDIENFEKLKDFTREFVKSDVRFEQSSKRSKKTIESVVSGAIAIASNPEATSVAAAPASTSSPTSVGVKQPFGSKTIVGLTVKPLRFITLFTGEKFFEGAKLPSGHILKKIDVKQLVLEKDGSEVIYELK